MTPIKTQSIQDRYTALLTQLSTLAHASDSKTNVKNNVNNGEGLSVTKARAPITLLPVTKSATIDQIKELLTTCPCDAIAENRVQQLIDRYTQLNGVKPLKWHLIGNLQKNKVKKAVKFCDVIQSVDSIELLRKIDHEAGLVAKIQSIYLQFNVSGEPQKFGFDPHELPSILSEIPTLKWISVDGVMAMAELSENEEKIRQNFKKTKALYDTIQSQYNDCQTLCMGMSNDYEIAIEEGATMVRIGRYLFE